MNPRTRRRHRLAIGLITAAALAAAGCGGDDDSETDSTDDTEQDIDTSPDDGVQLLAMGEGDTVELPTPYGVGQTSASSVVMDMDVAVDVAGQNVDVGFAMTMDMTQEVVAVDGDTTTIETTIDSLEVTDAPDEAADALDATFDAVTGKVLVAEYDRNGGLVGEVTVKDGSTLPPEFAQSLNQVQNQVQYPTEPVGVGGRWMGTTTVDSNGVEMEVETEFELTEITADEYLVTITQDAPIDEDVDGGSIEGTLRGTGEARVSRSNPALMDMSYSQDADFDIEADGQDGTMTMTIEMEMTSE